MFFFFAIFQDNLLISCAPLAPESAHTYLLKCLSIPNTRLVSSNVSFAFRTLRKGCCLFFWFRTMVKHRFGVRLCETCIYITKHLRRSQSAKTIHRLDPFRQFERYLCLYTRGFCWLSAKKEAWLNMFFPFKSIRHSLLRHADAPGHHLPLAEHHRHGRCVTTRDMAGWG